MSRLSRSSPSSFCSVFSGVFVLVAALSMLGMRRRRFGVGGRHATSSVASAGVIVSIMHPPSRVNDFNVASAKSPASISIPAGHLKLMRRVHAEGVSVSSSAANSISDCVHSTRPSHTVTISSLIIPVGVEAAYVSYTRRANVPTECRHDEVSSSTAVVLWSVWRCTLRSAMRGCAVAWWSGCRRARARRQVVLSLRRGDNTTTTRKFPSSSWSVVGGRRSAVVAGHAVFWLAHAVWCAVRRA